MTDSTAYFESVATSWSDIRQDLFPDDLRDKALDAVPLRPGALAADLGAGTGFLSEGLLERGLRVVAVDQSPAMLAELEGRLGPRTELETRQGTAEALPIADGEVDYVFSNMFLHHVEDPAAALREMARILAPGGRLVLTDLDAHQHEFLRTEHHDRWLVEGRENDWAVDAWVRGADQIAFHGLIDPALIKLVGQDECERCGAPIAPPFPTAGAIAVDLDAGIRFEPERLAHAASHALSDTFAQMLGSTLIRLSRSTSVPWRFWRSRAGCRHRKRRRYSTRC